MAVTMSVLDCLLEGCCNVLTGKLWQCPHWQLGRYPHWHAQDVRIGRLWECPHWQAVGMSALAGSGCPHWQTVAMSALAGCCNVRTGKLLQCPHWQAVAMSALAGCGNVRIGRLRMSALAVRRARRSSDAASLGYILSLIHI